MTPPIAVLFAVLVALISMLALSIGRMDDRIDALEIHEDHDNG